MTGRSGRRVGFTMIELLTVIAIIAILVAILFPVFAQVRKKTLETRCLSNMHQISQARQLYRDTWDKDPVVLDTLILNGVTFKPMAQFIKSEGILTCPASGITATDTTAVTATKRFPSPPNGRQLPGTFLRRDSYDGGAFPNRAGIMPQQVYELHYTRDWTECPSSFTDLSRQLKYRNPPANTVVTWCLNHADMDNQGRVSGNVLVLFFDGATKRVDGDRFSLSRWVGANNNPQPCAGSSAVPDDGYVFLANP